MADSLKFIRVNISFILLGAFWLFALMNPLFKKYDYGAGFPLVIVFGVILMLFAIAELKKKREPAFLEKLFLLIFSVFVVLSFVFSQTRNLGLSEVLAFLSVVVFYLIFAYQKNKWIGSFLKVVKVGAVLAVLFGFFLYFFRAEVRMIGPFFNTLYHAHVWPNAFALFLLMVWPVFLMRSAPKKAGGEIVKIIAIAMLISALLLTYSRGAMIAAGGQFILLILYFIRRIKIKWIVMALLTGAIAIGLFFGVNYLRALNHEVLDVEERVGFENSESLTSKQERVDFWLGAIELAKQKPIFGWGPYSFRQAYNPIQKTFLGNADHPHNVFLKIAAENGLIALAAFLAFLISVFVVVVRRFGGLNSEKRDTVYILGISILGAFAHNLIDYNLNFFANLLLLFIFLTFVRSLVIKKRQVAKPILKLLLTIAIAFVCIYEGLLLFFSEVSAEYYLQYSYFPRNYYLNSADEALSKGDFDKAIIFSDKELKLNPLDSQAWYLKGAAFCAKQEIVICKNNFEEALNLNPMNDFQYYLDYFRVLEERDAFVEEAAPILNDYFSYVENNVHFTAYTSNVEAAAELIDLMIPYLPSGDVEYFEDERTKMLEVAEELRKNKTF